MITFKCKMCGGDLSFEQGASVAECPYCGTNQTLPKLDDDKRANLYDRANHFRRQNEYDKAMAIYEQILAEDRTDAEAYWSLVLCRYGIEYVEDPSSRKRVPTVNRAQYASILADEDYKSALANADAAQRGVYEAEANAIAEIQRGILDISKQEEPFDVFICYKETDANGRRTPDSVLATELYHELTKEGFKVFFARITLEDKIGSAYEPYIFAALNSARVMVALGTKPEYFNAVWVKNEWRRYLALIKNGADKTLVPAYRDMDPYDLPEEFAHLQAQDMGKLGFMQDLIRGIKKILHKDEPKTQTVAQPIAAAPANNAAPLVKRAFMSLEDGDFAKADDFCEQALNIDPENGRAWLGKLMAQFKVRRESDLKNQVQPFDDNGNYQKAMRFGDDKLQGQLRGDIDHIKKRNEYDRQAGIYKQASEALQSARTEEECLKAKRHFQSIPDFEGVEQRIRDCDEKIEAINDERYRIAEDYQKQGSWQAAIDGFEHLGDYRDSRQRAQECRKAQEKQRSIEEQRRENERLAAEWIKKEEVARKRRNLFIIVAVIVLVIVGVLAYFKVIKPNSMYNSALSAFNAGNYDEAAEMFASLGDFKDAATQAKDAATQALEIRYQKGAAMLAAGNYDSATDIFDAIGNYKDATTQAMESQYRKGMTLLNEGKYDEAAECFEILSDYKDSATKAKECLANCRNKIAVYSARIAAGTYYTMGIRSDGTVIAVGDIISGTCNTGAWTDIVAVAAGIDYTVGLKSDGTVVAVGENKYGQCDTDAWTNIVAVAAGDNHSVGLKSDGTVVAVGNNISGACNTGSWTDIVAVAAGWGYTVGLKSDGTVVAVGKHDVGQCNTGAWTDIVAVAAKDSHTVGLKSDGTVVAVGSNYDGECDTDAWTDIVAVATGGSYTVGLKSDGTVVALGDNDHRQCDTGTWTDIVAVAAGRSHTVGLKSDGTVVAVGDNNSGRCDIDDWKLWD